MTSYQSHSTRNQHTVFQRHKKDHAQKANHQQKPKKNNRYKKSTNYYNNYFQNLGSRDNVASLDTQDQILQQIENSSNSQNDDRLQQQIENEKTNTDQQEQNGEKKIVGLKDQNVNQNNKSEQIMNQQEKPIIDKKPEKLQTPQKMQIHNNPRYFKNPQQQKNTFQNIIYIQKNILQDDPTRKDSIDLNKSYDEKQKTNDAKEFEQTTNLLDNENQNSQKNYYISENSYKYQAQQSIHEEKNQPYINNYYQSKYKTMYTKSVKHSYIDSQPMEYINGVKLDQKKYYRLNDVRFRMKRDNQYKYLLPLKTKNALRTIVLDLDETLIESVTTYEDDEKVEFETFMRPFVIEFLEALSYHYELILFTKATEDYARTILDAFNLTKYFDGLLFRQHLTHTHIKGQEVSIKDMKFLGRKLKYTCLIDDIAMNFVRQQKNGILIPRWTHENLQDDSLLILRKFFLSLNRNKFLYKNLDFTKGIIQRIDKLNLQRIKQFLKNMEKKYQEKENENANEKEPDVQQNQVNASHQQQQQRKISESQVKGHFNPNKQNYVSNNKTRNQFDGNNIFNQLQQIPDRQKSSNQNQPNDQDKLKTNQQFIKNPNSKQNKNFNQQKDRKSRKNSHQIQENHDNQKYNNNPQNYPKNKINNNNDNSRKQQMKKNSININKQQKENQENQANDDTNNQSDCSQNVSYSSKSEDYEDICENDIQSRKQSFDI